MAFIGERMTFAMNCMERGVGMTQECSADAIYRQSVSRSIVSADQVREWMNCGDLQVLGALWNHIVRYDTGRIVPGLNREEVQRFRFTYYARCLIENPHGEWADDRIEAAKHIVRWFWEIEEFGPDELHPEDVKRWLADTYRHAGMDTRTAIVSRVLARVCEYRLWREFFADWESDADLRDAYGTAAALGRCNSVEDVVDEVIATAWSEKDIPQVVVLCWMGTSHPDLLAAVWDHVLYREPVLARIRPPIGKDVGDVFSLRYYAMCINEDPDSKGGLSRYEAAAMVKNWIHALDCEEDRGEIERIAGWLADLYLAGDEAVRNAITTGALEHILEKPCYRPFFQVWAEHPVLKESYAFAMRWAVAHES